MGLKTVTNIPVEEVPARLQEIFDNPHAYKGVPSGADLTDINTGFMLGRVTEVFGLKGYGWNLKFRPEDMFLIEKGNRALARLVYAEFTYTLIDDAGSRFEFAVPTGGANENSINYAEEGARTSALGSALKGLTFQLPVYKGEYDHHDAHGDNKARARQSNAPARVTPPAKTNGTAKAAAPAPVAVADEAVAVSLKAVVPTGLPLAGQTFEQALDNQQFGEWVLKFIAKEVQNKSNSWFTPKNKDEEALVEHAKTVLTHVRNGRSN